MRSSTEQVLAGPVANTGPARFAGALLRAGITRIHGVMGDANLAWLSEWAAAADVVYLAARHEAGAIGMADGHAIATGETAISTVTWGPGLLNALNAIATSARGGRSQVVLIGSLPADSVHHVQRYDHEALVLPTGAEYRRLDDPALVDASLAAAVADARDAQQTIVLDLADEVLHAEPTPQRSLASRASLAPPEPTAEAVDAVARLLAGHRSLVLAGLGAVHSGAGEALGRIASATGADLATTLAARGLFARHPASIGVFGGFAVPAGIERIAEAEVVLAVGAGLNEYTTQHGTLLAGKTVIHVDRDRGALGLQHPVDLAVHADAGRFVTALLAAVSELEGPTPVSRPSISNVLVRNEDAGSPDGVDPRVAMTRLDALLPDDRMVVIDGGHFVEWPSRYLRAPAPRSFHTALAGGSVGMALAQGLGMASARRADAVVAVVGDGGFFMGISELETAVREGLPLIIVVVNDGGYGAEVMKLRGLGLDTTLAWFPAAADPAAVARGFGAEAHTVGSDADFALLPPLAGRAAPLVIDVRVDPAVVSARLAPAH